MCIKDIIKKTILSLGGEYILRLSNQTPRIIFWHGVDLTPCSLVEPETISKEDFEKQIKYLIKRFNIISIDTFYQRFLSGTLGKKDIVLTFDDGYKNNLMVLAPLMKEYNLPYTVFISTNNISTGNLFPTSIVRLLTHGSSLKELSVPSLKLKFYLHSKEDRFRMAKELSRIIKSKKNDEVNTICQELIDNISSEEYLELKEKYSSLVPLNWDEVRILMKSGAIIGSHCKDHICCHSNQDEEIVKVQIEESKKIIETELNINCDYFAYPNGDFTEYSNKCVFDAGYILGFSTKRDRISLEDNHFSAIPRISVPYNLDTFKIMVNLYPKKK